MNKKIRIAKNQTIEKFSPKDAGNALRIIAKRLKENNSEINNEELSHVCNNCKYRHGVEGYDQQWGMTYCVRSWCDRDRSLMDSTVGNKNHFIAHCEYFEKGEGVYERISKEK